MKNIFFLCAVIELFPTVEQRNEIFKKAKNTFNNQSMLDDFHTKISINEDLPMSSSKKPKEMKTEGYI